MPISSSSQGPRTASATTLSLTFDIWQGLEPTPITARIAGRVYTAPARDAAGWLTALGRAGWLKTWRFLPHEGDPEGLAAARFLAVMCVGPADAYYLSMAAEDGKVTAGQLAEAARRVWAKAAGVSWWAAERLAMQSVSWAGIGGALHLSGMRPDVPLPVWLGATYRTLMIQTDDEDRAFADASLSLPPPGYDSGDVQLASSVDELFS